MTNDWPQNDQTKAVVCTTWRCTYTAFGSFLLPKLAKTSDLRNTYTGLFKSDNIRVTRIKFS